jgi:deferrochelatase/peroxidase EfeB
MQNALRHSPGSHCAVVLYDRKLGVNDADLIRAAAKLCLYFDNADRIPSQVHVLVGLGIDLLVQAAGGSWFDPNEVQAAVGLFETIVNRLDKAPTQAALFVQIAAWNEADRLFALRMVRQALDPVAVFKDELAGNRIRDGEEAFGFLDGAPTAAALDNASGSTTGGAWLLLQHYRQNVAEFFGKSVAERIAMMGRVPAGVRREDGPAAARSAGEARDALASHADASTGGHARRMEVYRNVLLRRGFPCRQEGEEGLAFVGVAAHPDTLRKALGHYLGDQGQPDPLRPYTPDTHSSVYFCPADANFASVAPFEAAQAAERMRNELDLIAYEMPLAAYYYMDALTKSGSVLEGDALMGHDLAAFAKQHLDAIEAAAGLDPRVLDHFRKVLGNPALQQADIPPILRKLRDDAKNDANRINELLAKYFTIA